MLLFTFVAEWNEVIPTKLGQRKKLSEFNRFFFPVFKCEERAFGYRVPSLASLKVDSTKTCMTKQI